MARAAGRESHFLNGDAFFDSVKDQVAGLNEQRSGGRLECLVYSVAAPRRIDLDTGITCASAFKPIGRANRTRTLVFDGEDVPEACEGSPAHLYCIGPPPTAAIYVQGTIGAAKVHLEATARSLNDRLDTAVGGPGLTSVNGGAVTQSSTAVPGIALHTGLLPSVLGENLLPSIRQLAFLRVQLTGVAPLVLDDEGRVLLDAFELTGYVQAAVAERWESAPPRRPPSTWPVSTGSMPRSDCPTNSLWPTPTTRCRSPWASPVPIAPSDRTGRPFAYACGGGSADFSPLLLPARGTSRPCGNVSTGRPGACVRRW
ncbi:hypothetical protein [Streptomyces sp. NPDC090298]|uniref:hypothetical protein n=1 Tax=Streptomyces sp. NPDC090298 TaxID=3365959 RepID=UPI00381E2808